MKKILLLAILALAACQSNEEDEQTCTNKLWLLEKVCDPADATDCVYFATFGETEASAGTMQIQIETYNYYFAQGNTNNGSVCWEGTHED